MKKKIRRSILIGIIIFLICESVIIAVSSYLNSRNKEYGLTLSVENVSATGLTLTTQRNKAQTASELMIDHNYSIQKWTLFGWKSIATDSAITGNFKAESIEGGESWTRELQWDNLYGKLSPGIYRVSELARTIGSEEFLVYATFFVLF